MPPLVLIVDVGHVWSAEQEPGGDGRLRIVGPQLVPRDLLLHELVEQQVAVECLDHPVAIPPRIRPHGIKLKPVGLGEPGQIEPVLSPPFPVTGRSE